MSDPEATIRLKYSALMVEVGERGLESLSPVIDVASIEELARLAERQNTMILHLVHADVHYYLVKGDGMGFRFRTGLDQTNKLS